MIYVFFCNVHFDSAQQQRDIWCPNIPGVISTDPWIHQFDRCLVFPKLFEKNMRSRQKIFELPPPRICQLLEVAFSRQEPWRRFANLWGVMKHRILRGRYRW